MNSVPNLAPHELVVPTSRSPVKHTLIPGEHPTNSIASAKVGAQALREVLSRTAVKENRYKRRFRNPISPRVFPAPSCLLEDGSDVSHRCYDSFLSPQLAQKVCAAPRYQLLKGSENQTVQHLHHSGSPRHSSKGSPHDHSTECMFGAVDSLRCADNFHCLDARCTHYASIVGAARSFLTM